MSATATAEPMLETELWLSFVSMLRSYAAAASLHSPEIYVASSENSVAITASDVRLEMQFRPESSQITWQKSAPHHSSGPGRFELLHDGTVLIDGITKDLDHTAIDFIASLTKRQKGAAQ